MLASFETLYPLSKVTRDDLASLCDVLWHWKPCSDWTKERDCRQQLENLKCLCQRAKVLTPFFDFYKEVTAYYVPELTGGSFPALRTHGDLRKIIKYIKNNADKPRLQLTAEHFGRYMSSNSQSVPSNDQNRAFSLATRVMTMLQCSVEGQSDGLLEAGSQPIIWRSDQSFNQFINSAIPKQNQVSFGSEDTSPSIKLPPASITAKRLKKIAKLKVIPTNDFRNHLLLDEGSGTIAVYHYTSVLKEHISSYQYQNIQGKSESSTYQHVSLPIELALETLNTLKYVLFPIEPESQSILRSLIANNKFDPDNCHVDASSWQPHEGETIRYEYWGTRLMKLYDELEDPTPRGVLENWLERKSGARYVMLVGLIGVLIAILLGILSLAVTIFQAWISWKQWQNPVQ
ncbi:hypothetical protein F5B20DRAFT_572028 [Whalleya microplaca]|nr:hypothetical protein F5B20DRAFT_572028 [Whalleya microplaca]